MSTNKNLERIIGEDDISTRAYEKLSNWDAEEIDKLLDFFETLKNESAADYMLHFAIPQQNLKNSDERKLMLETLEYNVEKISKLVEKYDSSSISCIDKILSFSTKGPKKIEKMIDALEPFENPAFFREMTYMLPFRVNFLSRHFDEYIERLENADTKILGDLCEKIENVRLEKQDIFETDVDFEYFEGLFADISCKGLVFEEDKAKYLNKNFERIRDIFIESNDTFKKYFRNGFSESFYPEDIFQKDTEKPKIFLNEIEENIEEINNLFSEETLSKLNKFHCRAEEDLGNGLAKAASFGKLKKYLEQIQKIDDLLAGVENRLSKKLIVNYSLEKETFEYIPLIYDNLDKITSPFNDSEEMNFENYLKGIITGLGDYSKPFLENIRENFSKYKLIDMGIKFNKNEKIKKILAETNLDISSNKKVNQLFKFVDYAAALDSLSTDITKCIDEDWETVDKSDIKSINEYLKNKISDLFEGTDSERIMKFSEYHDYLNPENCEGNSRFSNLLNDIIVKNKWDGYDNYELPNLTTEVNFSIDTKIKEIKEKVENYNDSLEEKTGIRVDLSYGELSDYKLDAEKMYNKLKNWKRKNADKIEDSLELEKLSSRLKTIMEISENPTEKGTISFEPYNLEDQLITLKKAYSCMSPNGSQFTNSMHYLSEVPGIFFAVLKNSDGNIVGRTTIAVGEGLEDGKKYISRASNEYSNIPISDDEIYKAIEEYSKLINSEILYEGNMKIDNIGHTVYGDFMYSTGNEDIVEIKKDKNDFFNLF